MIGEAFIALLAYPSAQILHSGLGASGRTGGRADGRTDGHERTGERIRVQKRRSTKHEGVFQESIMRL